VHWLWTVELHWRQATLLAAAVAAVSVTLRRVRPRRWTSFAAGLTTEVAIILVLYALWQVAGSLSVSHIGGAMSRGRSLWDLERTLHLPSERWMQAQLLPHRALVQGANAYYALLHAPPLAVFLVWLFVWHRDRYASVRNVIVLLTGTCLLIQLIPVAPPRLEASLHMVDTARLLGQSVYGSIGTGISDQLSAMPSVHIGWSVLIGWYAVRLGRSPWRWLVLTHPAVMSIVVVVTANHYWLDGIVAVGVLVAAIGVEAAASALVRWSRRRPAAVAPRRAGADAAPPGSPAPPPASVSTPSLATTSAED